MATTDAWGREQWSPTAEPFRVAWVYRITAHPGWGTRVKTYATVDEALAAAREKFPTGIYEAWVDRAENAETWARNGRWRRVATRKARQELKMSRPRKSRR